MDSQTVKFFGRNYLIKFYALPAFYSSRESHLPVILLIVLLFPTILVAVGKHNATLSDSCCFVPLSHVMFAVVNVMVKWMTNMAAFEAERAASESKQRLALAQTARAAYEGTLRYGVCARTVFMHLLPLIRPL